MSKKPKNPEILPESLPEILGQHVEEVPEGIVAERVTVIENASKKRAKLMRDIFKTNPEAAKYLKKYENIG